MIYLYLARRDRQNVRILSTFSGDSSFPHTRVENLKKLNLPKNVESSLSQIIKKDRMLWEPWIEGASKYQSLKKSLEKRGYRNVPNYASNVLFDLAKIVEKKLEKNIIDVESSRRTMLRKQI